jgi:hypothetical protein
MNHKRKRPKNRRAGCLMCKSWKANGVGKTGIKWERFSDHKRRIFANREIIDNDVINMLSLNHKKLMEEYNV